MIKKSNIGNNKNMIDIKPHPSPLIKINYLYACIYIGIYVYLFIP